ncbi:MAG: MurR/RpiR family transcriptional regulator [Rhodoferax sp.]
MNDSHANSSPVSRQGLLQKLRDARVSLPRAQRQLCDVLLRDPAKSIEMSVEELAAQAAVSLPTMGRLAHSVGYSDARDFKLALAQDFVVSGSPLHRSVTDEDAAPVVLRKIAQASASAMLAMAQAFDSSALETAAGLVGKASRIDCYSVGLTSGFISQDLQGRLFRLGLPAHAISDAHSQLISAATLDTSGVAFAVSHVGRMPHLLEAVYFAKSQGAKVIALTQPGTPLADMADCLLAVNVPPDAVMRVGTEAYMAHLLVLEAMMVLVARNLGPSAAHQLQRFRRVLGEHGLDSENHPAVSWAWSRDERERLDKDQKGAKS